MASKQRDMSKICYAPFYDPSFIITKYKLIIF